jgi:hypothetical protein
MAARSPPSHTDNLPGIFTCSTIHDTVVVHLGGIMKSSTRRTIASLVAVITASLAPCTSLASLGPKVNYPAGVLPYSVSIADLNLDGKPDLVSLNEYDTLSVFLGTGSGAFGPRTRFDGPNNGFSTDPGTVATGDLNNDGKPDVVVGREGPGPNYVRLGQGNGTFGNPIGYPSGAGLHVETIDLGLADLNGDNKVDIVALETSSFVVYLGNGDGTFSWLPASNSFSGLSGGSLALGDYNNDTKMDVAIGTTGPAGTIMAFLGNGDGTFGSQTNSTALGESDAYAIAAGDLDRDGILDIAAGNRNTLHVTVMIGQGNGSFSNTIGPVTTIEGAFDIAVADVTNDGQLDVLTTHGFLGSILSVFVGNGRGGLSNRTDYASATTARGIAVADLNADVDLDVAVAGNGGVLSVHLNTGVSQVNVVNSFFAPQAGSVTSPTEGANAIKLFRMCPNNDGGTSLPNHARIKVVLRDSHGNPKAGIAAADICVLFNGGTAIQGFSGIGADSIIANSTYNNNPLCPDVRCVPADAATNALGETYITFTGANASNPGVGVRDPQRKWGHYDTELPVYVLGLKLSGRITPAAGNGSYVLRIKNFDLTAGLGSSFNVGETVTSADYSVFQTQCLNGQNPALIYWCDFDYSGAVTSADHSIISGHTQSHNCLLPNNP